MLGSLANDPFLSCLCLLVITYFMASPAGEYILSHSLAGDAGHRPIEYPRHVRKLRVMAHLRRYPQQDIIGF